MLDDRNNRVYLFRREERFWRPSRTGREDEPGRFILEKAGPFLVLPSLYIFLTAILDSSFWSGMNNRRRMQFPGKTR